MQTVNIRALVFTALFAALFIVLSLQQMRITVTPVPITFQTFGVILAGVFLRPRLAFASIFIVLVISAFGLPIFGGKGGLAHLLGYTGGFLFAFPFGALLISLAIDRLLATPDIMRHKTLTAVALFLIFELFSSLLSYITGIPWMMHVLEYSLGKALATGFYPFIPGDAVKSALGVIVTMALLPYVARSRSIAS